MLKHLAIESFRNISSASFEFGPHFNFLYGDNGAGKTSVLEAVFCLARGKSFRTTNQSRAVQEGATHFALLGKNDFDSQLIYKRLGNNRRTIEMNGSPIVALVDLLDFLPVVVLNSDSFALIQQGPSQRRQYLDWGLFHVEHDYRNCWSKANRAIKQRNVLLKHHASKSEVSVWDAQISNTAELLDQKRKAWVVKLSHRLREILEQYFSLNNITLEYKKGWRSDVTLFDVLQENYLKDIASGFTKEGPHKADLIFLVEGQPVSDILSGGEQKKLLYALKLSQTCLLKTHTQRNTVFLLDDLQAELDSKSIISVNKVLRDLDAQVFVTGTNKTFFEPLFDIERDVMFHVERGCFSVV